MDKGTVKWFNSRKGFGFITLEDGSQDIFVHYTSIKGDQEDFKTIFEGDEVEFNIVEGKKGSQASDVVVTKKGPRQSSPRQRNFY